MMEEKASTNLIGDRLGELLQRRRIKRVAENIGIQSQHLDSQGNICDELLRV